MSTASSPLARDTLLADLLSDDAFRPAEPRTIPETGLSATILEDLVCKYLLVMGSASGRDIATNLCLPFAILEVLLSGLRTKQTLVQVGSAQMGDYVYGLTEQGRVRAQSAMASCAYVGPAPVTLPEYVNSVEAQTIRAESPRRQDLEKAFGDISVNGELFDRLGPAINSGAGLFLYGEPGNGKTTLAKRMTSCFGHTVFIPHAIIESGQIIKIYDAAYHETVDGRTHSLIKTSGYDQRWVRVRRPTVVVGGELTLDALEIRHDPHSNVSEAPIQMKSNCGCLLIDDFGRQQVDPLALLNRWIVPLENRIDFLTLATGKKIQVPFELLIIFSTNLEPSDLVDEAFLRRIPYKIEVADPDEQEFHRLFQHACSVLNCPYQPEVVDWLLATHYRPARRSLRRCHPRDLLQQIRNYCTYNDLPLEMRPEYFDHVVPSNFTDVSAKQTKPRDSQVDSAAPPRPPEKPASINTVDLSSAVSGAAPSVERTPYETCMLPDRAVHTPPVSNLTQPLPLP